MTATGLPSVAREIEVSVQALTDYVNRALVPLRDRVIQLSADFGSMPNYQNLFGPIPAARELDARHRDAYQVYAPTIRALGDDLDLLIGKLRAVIKNYSDEDDNVAESLIRLGNKLSGGSGYQSDEVYQRAAAEAIGRSVPVSAPAAASPVTPEPAAPASAAPPITAPPEPPPPTRERGF